MRWLVGRTGDSGKLDLMCIDTCRSLRRRFGPQSCCLLENENVSCHPALPLSKLEDTQRNLHNASLHIAHPPVIPPPRPLKSLRSPSLPRLPLPHGTTLTTLTTLTAPSPVHRERQRRGMESIQSLRNRAVVHPRPLPRRPCLRSSFCASCTCVVLPLDIGGSPARRRREAVQRSGWEKGTITKKETT